MRSRKVTPRRSYCAASSSKFEDTLTIVAVRVKSGNYSHWARALVIKLLSIGA